ncbi:MAG: MBL fold metallo-hydrolase, partial [Hyphomicrobiaceae bacterium]
VLTRWDQAGGIIPELKVHGPPGTQQMSEQLLGEAGAYALDIRARTELEASLGYYQKRGGTLPRPRPQPDVTELKASDVIEADAWRLTIANVPHAQPVLTCYAYRFDTDAGSLVYSGDASSSKTLTALAHNCDVLIHMCHRISGTELTDHGRISSSGHLEVARTAQEAGAKTCVLTHITEQMDSVGMHEKLLREMAAIYDGNLIWGEDLLSIPTHGPAAGELI